MRFALLALLVVAPTVLGCHRWTHIARSEVIPREVPLAVAPVQITAKTMVNDAPREVGIAFAKYVASDIDARLAALISHDGARVRDDARVRVSVTLLGVKPATNGWLPTRASLTALVEVRRDDVVTDAVVTEVVEPKHTPLGAAAARDIADWVAYRRAGW